MDNKSQQNPPPSAIRSFPSRRDILCIPRGGGAVWLYCIACRVGATRVTTCCCREGGGGSEWICWDSPPLPLCLFVSMNRCLESGWHFHRHNGRTDTRTVREFLVTPPKAKWRTPAGVPLDGEILLRVDVGLKCLGNGKFNDETFCHWQVLLAPQKTWHGGLLKLCKLEGIASSSRDDF